MYVHNRTARLSRRCHTHLFSFILCSFSPAFQSAKKFLDKKPRAELRIKQLYSMAHLHAHLVDRAHLSRKLKANESYHFNFQFGITVAFFQLFPNEACWVDF
jgi:hypothetical protein